MLNVNKEVTGPQANLACIFMGNLDNVEYIIDSSASHHIIASLNTFTNVGELNSSYDFTYLMS